MCCTEADRAKQLRVDELSIQEKESTSTLNQLMVQIQELQEDDSRKRRAVLGYPTFPFSL